MTAIPVEEPKDCAFQFFKGGVMVEDTGLITNSEARDLWKKHRPAFIECVKDGIEAEVGLWVDMAYETNYRNSEIRLRSDDVVMKGNCPCVMEPMP